MSLHAAGMTSLVISMILSSAVNAEDDYLKSLEAEAQKLAPAGSAVQQEAPAESGSRGDRVGFEAELAKHKGTYSFYRKLQEKDRAEVFKAYEEGADFARIRRMIINSTLSYFRLPPEASSQGVLSSSVSFMNDAGNTIWRWLRSW